jgi:low temperature requirement protein LtrA
MPEPARVTTLELFFDLVFVFTLTQLTALMVDGGQPRALAQVTIMLGLIFWMYGGYAWLTNAVTVERTERRLMLLAGMAGFLVIALAIPKAFKGDGLEFGLAYVLVVTVHTALYTRTSSEASRAAILRIAPFNAATGGLVLAGGALGGDWQWGMWAAAFLLEWLTPLLAGTGDFEIEAPHFVERHGLLVIIAIGESIVAIGIGAGKLPLDAALIGVAVLGLAVSAGMWWAYFGRDEDAAAEHALAHAPPGTSGKVAIEAFGYAHFPILLGIIAAAAGLKFAIAHPSEELELRHALELAGGLSLFLLGDALFRARLGLDAAALRGAAALAALVTVPLGMATSATLQLAALVLVMVAAVGSYRVLPAAYR